MAMSRCRYVSVDALWVTDLPSRTFDLWILKLSTIGQRGVLPIGRWALTSSTLLRRKGRDDSLHPGALRFYRGRNRKAGPESRASARTRSVNPEPM